MKQHFFRVLISASTIAVGATVHADWPYVSTTSGNDFAVSVECDTQGNIYIGGGADNEFGRQVMVEKFSRSGQLIWHSSYDRAAFQGAAVQDLKIGSDGSVYAVGGTYGDIGSRMLTLKYDANGQLLWSRQIAADGRKNIYGEMIELGSNGEVLVSGRMGLYDHAQGYLAVYTNDGTEKWKTTLPGSIAGNVAASYDSTGSIVTMSTTTDAAFNEKGVLRKFSSDGAVQWTRYYVGVANPSARFEAMKIDGADSVVIAATDSPENGVLKAALLKYSSNGERVWLKHLQGETSLSARALAIAPDDSIAVGVLGDNRALVARYGANGDRQWVSKLDSGSIYYCNLVGVDFDSAGNIYVAGSWGQPGSCMVWSAKFDASGVRKYHRTFHRANDTYEWAYQMGLDTQRGTCYVAGSAVSHENGGQADTLIAKL